jgi:endogenous inhibitor of DNA gyrase (YacG/DUF329 family)
VRVKAGAERIVRCPHCGGPSVYGPSNRWRPFCSERCRNLDLGAWASEGYRIASPPAEPGADDAAPTDESSQR